MIYNSLIKLKSPKQMQYQKSDLHYLAWVRLVSHNVHALIEFRFRFDLKCDIKCSFNKYS